jgi:hypothetical protein
LEEAYRYTLSLKQETYPKRTRGKDVGWQNFVADSQFIPKVNLGVVPPKGPILYKDLMAHLKQLRIQEKNPEHGYRPVFLRINLKNVLLRNAYTSTYGVPGMDVLDPNISIPGYLPIGSVFCKYVDNNKQYVNGPSPSFDTTYYQYTKLSADFKKFPYMLFAREDICTRVPCKQISSMPLFEADFFKTTTDINLMYTDLGLSAKNEPKVVVLKCFLYAYKPALEGIDHRFYKHKEYLQAGFYKYTPENVTNDVVMSPPVHSLKLLQKVDDVLNNLGDILTASFEIEQVSVKLPDNIIYEINNRNAVFQGFYKGIRDGIYIYKKVTRIDNFARYVMHEICKLQNIDIPKYPKICACIGQGTEVADTRIALKNSMYRPMCHNAECVDADPNSTIKREIFHFRSPLPCSEMIYCNKDVNLGFTRNLSIKNSRASCQFSVEFDPDADDDEYTELNTPTSNLHGASAATERQLKTTGLAFGMVLIFLLLLFLFNRR